MKALLICQHRAVPWNVGGLVFPSYHPNCFLSTQAYIFINFHLSGGKKKSSTGVDNTWLNNRTSTAFHNEVIRLSI